MKVMLMFLIVLFGAYSQYDAAKTVNTSKQNKMSESAGDHKFMKRALELSLFAIKENHGEPFGSVVVKDGKIIGEGWNGSRLSADPSAHAEIVAIREACRHLGQQDLSNCTIYASAQPCPMCLSLIYLTNIRMVYYCIPQERMSNMNKDLAVDHIYEALSRPQNERSVNEVQILDEEVDKYLHSYLFR